jgi:hypothetical protein
MKTFRLFLMFVFVLYFINLSFAEDIVPTDIQSLMILKLIPYDKELKTKTGGNVKIGVFYNNNSHSVSSKSEFISAFNKQIGKISGEVNFSLLETNDVNALKSVNVIYVTPNSEQYLDSIKSIARSSKIMTTTGVAKYVEDGKVSVAITSKNNKPKILVNLPSAEAEGVNFSSNLLKLAEVIK